MFLICIVALLLISLFTFLPTFNLALFGDDWLAFWRYFVHLGPKSAGQWNHLTYFLTPYGPQDVLMGLLQKIYGYNSSLYHLTSYSFRMIAAISFYPLVFYLTKSKLASYFAVLFFSITTIGLDTTNWVFNMPSYVTIALFNIFLYFFLKSREENRLKLLILGAIFYYLAYVTTPIRMHGSLLFIFLLEVFWIFQKRSFTNAKMAALRFSIILIVFLIIRFTGQSLGVPQELMERFMIGLTADLQMFSQGRFDFIFYPVVMFGGMIIPDFLLPSVQVVSKSKLLWSIVPVFLGFIVSLILLSKNLPLSKMKFFKEAILLGIAWNAVVVIINRANLNTFSDSRNISLLLTGGYALIISILLLVKFFKRTNISTSIFLGLSWSILSFFFAWWWVPQSIFPTTYRYLIVSAIGVPILLAVIISLAKNFRSNVYIVSCLSILLVIHIFATRQYLSQLFVLHNQEITDKIWSSIPHIPEIGQSKEPLVFYFEGDGTNAGILHNVITFGFPPHMALLYNIREGDRTPVPMSDFREVISAVKDGQSFKAYGFPQKPIPLDRIYAFHLEDKDNLINITDLIRQKLQQVLFSRQ